MKNILSTCLVLLISLISGNLLAKSYAALPENMNQLVKSSDLIIIGTIGEIVNKQKFWGYGETAEFIAKMDPPPPDSLALPLVDYSINVREVIMDDKDYPISKSKKEVILRVFEDEYYLSSESAKLDKEGTMIFFLGRNPDGKTYGVSSLMHKIRLDNADNKASYSFEGKTYHVPVCR